MYLVAACEHPVATCELSGCRSKSGVPDMDADCCEGFHGAVQPGGASLGRAVTRVLTEGSPWPEDAVSRSCPEGHPWHPRACSVRTTTTSFRGRSCSPSGRTPLLRSRPASQRSLA